MTSERSEHTPSQRAMNAAVAMEIHSICSTTTAGKAAVLDENFPAYDDLVSFAIKARDFARVMEDDGMYEAADGVLVKAGAA